jgi:hypothetical protein
MGPRAFILITVSLYTTGLLALDTSMAQYSEMINSLNSLQRDSKNVGTIEPGCLNCQKSVEPDKRAELNSKNIDLDRPLIYKDNTPFVIHLKRTKDSPLKTTLKFKNGHTECAKMFVGTNPWISNGPLVVGCAYSHTVYVDHEIDLDLNKLPRPMDNEEQIIELKITKPNIQNSYYSLDAEVLKGPGASVKKSKKFWGEGYNVELSEREADKANP